MKRKWGSGLYNHKHVQLTEGRGNGNKEIACNDPLSMQICTAHREWYRELFQPCVAAGLLKPARSRAIATMQSICGHRGMCRRGDAVRDAMRALFNLMQRK